MDHSYIYIGYLQFKQQGCVRAGLVHRIQIDNVVLALAEHQDSNLVLDLLVAALGASASLQEFGSEMQTGILVYCPANGRKFAPRKSERERHTRISFGLHKAAKKPDSCTNTL